MCENSLVHTVRLPGGQIYLGTRALVVGKGIGEWDTSDSEKFGHLYLSKS